MFYFLMSMGKIRPEDARPPNWYDDLDTAIWNAQHRARTVSSDVVIWDSDNAVLAVALAGTGDLVDLRDKVEDDRKPEGHYDDRMLKLCGKCGVAHSEYEVCSECDDYARIPTVEEAKTTTGKGKGFEDLTAELGTDFTTKEPPASASEFLCDDCGQEIFDCCCKREGEPEDGPDIPF
ncbi:MAG TPA: hypothetical protein VH575_31995 [Gemmataceae bacterium]|jgi:hypothetical protein